MTSEMIFYDLFCIAKITCRDFLAESQSRWFEYFVVLCKRAETRIDPTSEKPCSNIVRSPNRAASIAYLIRAAFAAILWIILASALSPDFLLGNYCAFVLNSTCVRALITPIRIASSNWQLYPRAFLSSLWLFFLCCYVLSTFVGIKIHSASAFVWNEIQSMILQTFHRAIVTLQLLELTSHGFVIIYHFRHSGRCAYNPSVPNIGERNNVLPPSVVSAFPLSFSLSSSVSCLCRSWSWLSSLPRRQQRRLSRSKPNLSRWRDLTLYWRLPCPSRIYRRIGEIVALRIRNVLFSARRPRWEQDIAYTDGLYPCYLWFIVSEAKCSDRKIDFCSEYVIRKEALLLLDSTERHLTLIFATILYLQCRTIDMRSLS